MSTGPEFDDNIAYGCLLSISQKGAGPSYTLQNFFSTDNIDHNGGVYGFAPFGWSGVTVNRNGDNESTRLIFPNENIVQVIVGRIFNNTSQWLAKVETALLNPDDRTDYRILTEYVGMIVSGSHAGPTIEVEVGSILDAVGADVPRRRITEDLFGPMPTTANVRLQ